MSVLHPVRLPSSRWQALMFPFALVLYEFSTYIANDMILPGMLAVTAEFNAETRDIPTALTAYMLGGASLQWFLGPLSDRIGRRPVMLFGVVLFTLTCLLTLAVHSIEQFLIMRFIQGMGLCFVTSVGYATVQESFDEANAVKVTALMANVALISPLIGPLVGALMITIWPWRMIFVAIAVLALFSLVGLYRHMPEPGCATLAKNSLASVGSDYRHVLTNRRFLAGTFAVGFCSIPLLAWIGQSPVILMKVAGLSPLVFGLWQLPVFGTLIIANVVVTSIAHRAPIERLVRLGSLWLLAGLFVSTAAMLWDSDRYEWLVFGLSIHTFGLGIANAALTRLTLFSSPISKGTVAAVFSMGTMALMASGVEFTGLGYSWGGNLFYALTALVSGIIGVGLAYRVIRTVPDTAAQKPLSSEPQ